MTPKQRILVVGGTGMLGAPVARRLAADGFMVRILSQRPDAARQMFGEGVEVAGGDVRDPASLIPAVADCHGMHINLRATRLSDFATVEVVGTQNLVAAAKTTGVHHITYLSGAGIERADPKLLPVRTKRAAEQALCQSGIGYTILRATHFMESLALFVRGPSAVLIGHQPHRYHYLAADDYAAMVSAAYRTPAALGRELTLLGPQPFTMAAALELYLSYRHPNMKIRRMPLSLFRLLATFSGNADMKVAAMLFDAFRHIPESDDGQEAARLLGPATTTLVHWCARQQA